MARNKPCKISPSNAAACRFLNGEPNGAVAVIGTTLGRAALIGAGMWIFGLREPKDLVKYAIAGALGVEAAVFYWAL